MLYENDLCRDLWSLYALFGGSVYEFHGYLSVM